MTKQYMMIRDYMPETITMMIRDYMSETITMMIRDYMSETITMMIRDYMSESITRQIEKADVVQTTPLPCRLPSAFQSPKQTAFHTKK